MIVYHGNSVLGVYGPNCPSAEEPNMPRELVPQRLCHVHLKPVERFTDVVIDKLDDQRRLGGPLLQIRTFINYPSCELEKILVNPSITTATAKLARPNITANIDTVCGKIYQTSAPRPGPHTAGCIRSAKKRDFFPCTAWSKITLSECFCQK